MVAFLANGIIILFLLAIAAVVGFFKLIGKIIEYYQDKKAEEEWKRTDYEGWKRLHDYNEYLKKTYNL